MSSPQSSVLVVDDEPALRKALRTSLIASGFAVEEARDRPNDSVTFCLKLPNTKDEALHVLTAK